MEKTKNMRSALVFSFAWIAYCLAVIIPNPGSRTVTSFLGLVIGSVFMWLTAWGLLALIGRVRASLKMLIPLGILLLAADLITKQFVFHYLANGTVITLVPGWLSINFAPNYSNNVFLNLLNIVVESNLFHAVSKLLIFAVVGVLLYLLCRKEKYDVKDPRFLWAVMFVSAGALSSIIESFYRGYVLDFISFASLVSFDIKDLCIMYGMGLFIIVVYHWEKDAKQKKKLTDAPPQ